MSFETRGRTMMGVTPGQVLESFKDKHLVALGANCGKGPEQVEIAIQAMKEERPDIFLVAKPNAGVPQLVNGQVVYDGTPDMMADFALKIKVSGAKFIGACCGSTPAHIAAMAKALK
jgi:5-methyltetrahydrofolate--homocysteine methyltransferase